MLVPSMTLQEIKHALITDYSREMKLKFKGLHVCIRGKWLRNGQKDFIETISHISKSRNHWRIIVQMKGQFASIMPYMVAYDHVGITASHITDPSGSMEMLNFNTHFFKRYRERMNLDIEKPEEVVKYFFKRNPRVITGYYPMPDGTNQLFCPINGGVGLGYYHEESGVLQFKTFVDDSLLRENQKRDLARIWRGAMSESDKKAVEEMHRIYANAWWWDYAA